MMNAYFGVILAVMLMPFDPMPGSDDMAAGPCNPEVQDCP